MSKVKQRRAKGSARTCPIASNQTEKEQSQGDRFLLFQRRASNHWAIARTAKKHRYSTGLALTDKDSRNLTASSSTASGNFSTIAIAL